MENDKLPSEDTKKMTVPQKGALQLFAKHVETDQVPEMLYSLP